MAAYFVPACYEHSGSSLFAPHQSQSFASCVGSVLGVTKLLTIFFVVSLTGNAYKRLQTMVEFCIDNLALLDKQLYILHDFEDGLGGIVRHAIATLVHILSRFPFNTNTVNTWFHVPQENVAGNVGVVHAINLDNAGRTNRLYSPQYNVAFPDGLADNKHKLFFHGTSHEGAQNIMQEGIDLLQGTNKGDFSSGRGFYLTDEFNTAFEWADARYNCQSQAAVIVFKFDRNRLSEYERMNLCENDVKEEWESVVRKCRSGRGLKEKALRGIDYIDGPMANISRDRIREVPHSYQLCILSGEMAEAFDECLHSVVFHSGS